MRLLRLINYGLFLAIKEFIIWVGAGLTTLVFLGIVRRVIFGSAFIWAYEASILALVWISFLGAATALRLKQHIRFDMLAEALPKKLSRLLVAIQDAILMVICAAGVYYGWRVAKRTSMQEFQTLSLSVGWLYAAIPAGFAPMFLFLAEIFVDDLGRLFGAPALAPASANTNSGEG